MFLDETVRPSQDATDMYQHVVPESTKLAVMTLRGCQAERFLKA
jgi:hypothetical protein